MPIWQLCVNLLIPNCLRSNLSYSLLAALELYVKKTVPLCFLIKCKKEESLNKRESTCQYLFFLKLIGSLVLLMYGMKTVSEALQKPTGGYLRHILGAMTTNRFTGLLTGAFVTAFVQSSTATNGIFGRRRISFG